jgi:type II secretory ATPase GspE/PulE/Tfp pilus assembly ATPase PilB-like protein
MSNLDISERRKPQSGKILITSHDQKIEYRVEISPTVGGNEDAVLRILTSAEPLPLEDMGFSESNLKAFRSILKQPYGMILCVGPTGSGKTTTLHSALKSINTPEVKIWTVEDPVEITQKGLRQVQVHAKIGLTFQEALRSFLRSDPDIIMVGEMRDAETTKIALEASLTGHLVLSTLHTNSAPETVARLIEMGMDPFNFSDSLLGVLAQRLARRLCVKCKETYHPDPDEYDELMMIYDRQWFQEHNMQPYSPDLTLMRRVGCEACNGGGYKGRIAIHELLANTDSIKQLIRRRAEMDELRKTAIREGMKTLQMDGVEKVFQGLTDRDELLRVCRLENSGG